MGGRWLFEYVSFKNDVQMIYHHNLIETYVHTSLVMERQFSKM
jgi:hypothetical protein